MPLLVRNSFIFNVLMSTRHLVEQYKACNSHQIISSSSGGLAAQYWDVLGLFNPFGLGGQQLAVEVLSPPERCFLVFITSELVALAVCWWSAWCIERHSRLRYLKQMHAEELERQEGAKPELFLLLLHEPIGIGVRLACLLLYGISLMWTGVLITFRSLS